LTLSKICNWKIVLKYTKKQRTKINGIFQNCDGGVVDIITYFYTIIMLRPEDSRVLRCCAASISLTGGLGLPDGEDGGVHYSETSIIIHKSTWHNVP
jgi:hypothetical protein